MNLTKYKNKKRTQLMINTSNPILVKDFNRVKSEIESSTGLKLSNPNIIRVLITNFDNKGAK